ncbi:unnamed protein product [Owenia fusiformis]|uniref:Dipeptidase n=1 Tax=Owenia fusiformis TaxID=6347 RepID=A0A8J1Y847_OWEFU|nr:unnamed protein product [Owenia fusiformis]
MGVQGKSASTQRLADQTEFRGNGKINRKVAIGAVAGLAVLATVLGVAIGVPLSKRQADNTDGSTSLQRARDILSNNPLIDGHNDLPWQYKKQANNSVESIDLEQSLKGIWSPTHTDIPRLREGRVGAQFWAAYVPCDSQYKDAVRLSFEQCDTVRRFVKKFPDTFQFVTSAQEIEDAFAAGKIGSMIGLEGGHSIDSSLATLRMFYDVGVRYMTVTHSCNTPWADNWLEDEKPLAEQEFGGLSAFGELVILEMNRLGMLVDLSHVSKATMEDALRVTKAPVIYSHTSAYTICNHYRNVQDDVLQLTKENNGVVMVNFYDKYINCPPGNTTNATLSQVADHIDHIKDLIGADYVGIGADYDGVATLPQGLEDVSTYPEMFAELIDRGWTDEDLIKLAGGNLLRVFRAAEEVSKQMAADGVPPYEELIDESTLKNKSCRWEGY